MRERQGLPKEVRERQDLPKKVCAGLCLVLSVILTWYSRGIVLIYVP